MTKHSQPPVPASSDAAPPPAANYPTVPPDPSDASVEPSPLNPKFLVPHQPGNRPRTPDSFNSVAFADLPLYIPNVSTPYVGYHGALNIAATEVHKELGVLFILLPYLDRAEFDVLHLFYGDALDFVAAYTITKDDIVNNRPIPMYVPPNRIIHGPVSPVFVRVSIFGGGTAETLHLNLFVDKARPADVNPIASTVQNENLHKPIFPQDLIDFGVGPDDISVPIAVRIKHYPVDTSRPADTFRKVRDRIRLSIGGRIIPHSVTEGEAGGTDDIVIRVNTSDWKAIGTGSHVCEYEVVDEAGNHSDGWSPAQVLDVMLEDGAEPLLPIAFVQEAPDNILDHDTLVGDAHIFIFISGNGYATGDIIRVTINGRAAGGEPLITNYDSPPLSSTTAFYLTLPLPNEDVKALVGGRFQLRYKRIRSGVPDRLSRSNIVGVIGTELPVGLAPPYFIEAQHGDILEPQELFFTAVIPEYVGQKYYDLVTLILIGTYVNGNPYYDEYEDIAGDGDGLRLIPNGPNGDIAKLEGGTLRIYYLVENENGLRPPSQDRLYNVGQPAASLAEPRILEAPGPLYQFDPLVSLGNANVRVLPDADIKSGDTVRMYALGNAPGGTPSILPFPVTAFWEGRTLPFTLPKDNVTKNTVMRIYYARDRENAPTRYSHQVDMKIGSAPDLGVPKVLESTVVSPTSSTLNPTHVVSPPVFTVRVPYLPMFASDDITVKLIVKPGLTPPFIAPKSGNPSQGFVDFTLSNTHIANHIGESLKIQYHVRRAGADYDSGILDLLVLNFDELPGGNPLPQAAINDLPSNTTLDLNLFASDAMAGVIPWPLMRANQRVWLTVERAGVAPHKVLDGYLVLASEVSAGIKNKAVSRTWLDQLANGSKISLRCAVAFDGGNETNAINFPITEYNIVSKLSVDNSLLTLDGISVRVNWPRSGADSIGNTAVRQAKGGHPNYTYTSNNQAVANVDPLSGKVTGNKNGTATISIKDDKNNTVSYPVTVRNVFNLITNDNFVTADKAVQWRQSLSNGTIISQAALLDMRRTYINPLPTRQHYWYCDPAPGSCHDDARRFFHRENQGNYCAIIPGGNIAAWCMQPT
ncbi:Ig-like domain-containing protein [Pseudomonas pergaminensis]